MRHRKSINQLGRKTAHRGAMLSNMAASLIMHKKINTTLAKAKSLREYVEPLITRSKEDTTHNRRMVFSYLQNKEAVTELFRNISQKIIDRPGGYTRIFKTGSRSGDNADMCLIELVDYNETYQKETKSAGDKAKTRRSRGKKKTDTADVTTVKEKLKTPAVTKEDVDKSPAEPEITDTVEEVVEENVTEITAIPEPVDETPVELTDEVIESTEEIPATESTPETPESTIEETEKSE